MKHTLCATDTKSRMILNDIIAQQDDPTPIPPSPSLLSVRDEPLHMLQDTLVLDMLCIGHNTVLVVVPTRDMAYKGMVLHRVDSDTPFTLSVTDIPFPQGVGAGTAFTRIGGEVYAYGGRVQGSLTDVLHVMDIATYTWRQVGVSHPPKKRASRWFCRRSVQCTEPEVQSEEITYTPVRRDGAQWPPACTNAVTFAIGGKLVVVSAKVDDSNVRTWYDDVTWVYDTDNESWQYVMPSAGHTFRQKDTSIAVVGERVYLADRDTQYMRVFTLDCGQGRWERVAYPVSMRRGGLSDQYIQALGSRVLNMPLRTGFGYVYDPIEGGYQRLAYQWPEHHTRATRERTIKCPLDDGSTLIYYTCYRHSTDPGQARGSIVTYDPDLVYPGEGDMWAEFHDVQ
ncbi:hypothetical protein KIPB_011749 [Kipferlia bialata]|uniref:Uncharacterized protein n=1 Tax=Kipferlia bialata TaxID=797122 RepID=A0A9K3D8H6_9EUKA|nr:hypothetical protein KIPB_011749 [Kipferlia bialata]|eukprot:g11749.t1